jgi:hypothetical protein
MESWEGSGESGVGSGVSEKDHRFSDTLLPTPYSHLPDLYPIADPHRVAHRDDLPRRGMRIRGQDADFA